MLQNANLLKKADFIESAFFSLSLITFLHNLATNYCHRKFLVSVGGMMYDLLGSSTLSSG